MAYAVLSLFNNQVLLCYINIEKPSLSLKIVGVGYGSSTK
jgi:hypothetical protein